MNNLFLIITKKHFKTNKSATILNFIAFILIFFSLITVVSIISAREEINKTIVNSFPNSNVYSISKKASILNTDGIGGIAQYERPSKLELKNFDVFKNSKFEIDLSYLLDTYEVKINGFKENISISFEPHFLDSNFYYENFDLSKSVEILFLKDFVFDIENHDVIETFKFSIPKNNFYEINTFKFLDVPTVYYPYNIIKNAAKSTYFDSIGIDLFSFIEGKGSNESETNYSLLMIDNAFSLNSFNDSETSNVYYISSKANEIAKTFMDLFNAIINFSFYFLIVICVLVLVLFIYALNLLLIKNHKEISLLRVYGKKVSSINRIYLFEVMFLFVLAFSLAVFLSVCALNIINSIFYSIFNVSFYLSILNVNTLLIFVLLFIVIFTLSKILLLKIRKVNIRKELNSL